MIKCVFFLGYTTSWVIDNVQLIKYDGFFVTGSDAVQGGCRSACRITCSSPLAIRGGGLANNWRRLCPRSPIDNKPALFQVMAWCRTGDKPLPGQWWPSLLTHICRTMGRWVNAGDNEMYNRICVHFRKTQVAQCNPLHQRDTCRHGQQYDFITPNYYQILLFSMKIDCMFSKFDSFEEILSTHTCCQGKYPNINLCILF